MKLEDALKFDIVEETVADEKMLEIKSSNDDIPYDSDEILPESVLPVGFVSKPSPADSEIFDDKVETVIKKVQQTIHRPPEIKVVRQPYEGPSISLDEATEPIDTTSVGGAVKLTKKGRPRKKMTDEHKEKLRQSRLKALAKKQYLANERKIAKMKVQEGLGGEELDQDFEDKQLKQKEELEQLSKKKEVKKEQAITRADLEELTMKSLIAMETLRKKRKAEKKKKIQEQNYQQEVMQTIAKAQPSWILNDSPFNDCF